MSAALEGNSGSDTREGTALGKRCRQQLGVSNIGRLRGEGSPITQKPPMILVPIDFSNSATEAAEFGMSVARRARGQLLLIHAIHLNLDPYGPARLQRLKAELCEEAFAHSEPLMLQAREAGVAAICTVEEGEPANVIARAARRWEVDLIVLAERERNRFARWFRRGITERVIQQVKCPVFVLRKDATQEVL